MVSSFEKFSVTIFGIYRKLRRVQREEMVKHGYKGSYARYLTLLNRYEQGLSSMEICRICDLDRSIVSRTTTEMYDKGLLERTLLPHGAYRYKLTLTEKGKEIADSVNKITADAAKELSKEIMNAEERDVFYSILDSIYANLLKSESFEISAENTENK